MSVENVTKLEKRMIVKTLYQMCLILYDTPTFITFSLLPSFLYRARSSFDRRVQYFDSWRNEKFSFFFCFSLFLQYEMLFFFLSLVNFFMACEDTS